MTECWRQFAASPSGDRWFISQRETTGQAYVVHQASSGGAETHLEVGDFLTGPRQPQHDAFLRWIGGLAAKRPPGA